MDWKLVLIAVFTTLQGRGCRGQGLDRTTVGNFSCDGDTRTSNELLTRTTETGTISSPCYGTGTRYPEEQVSGLKLTFLNFDSNFLAGYRLTIRDFVLASTDRLYIGDALEGFAGNQRAVRNFTLFSNSSDDRVYLQQGEDGPVLDVLTLNTTNNTVNLNFFPVYLDFYTVVDSVGMIGYLIDYAADIDRCLFTGADIYCKNGGVCTKTGFNSASCNCDGTGYEGTICTVDIDECANSADNNCHSNATCDNNNGSFTCDCNDGFTGPGTACTDINECTDGTHSCADTGTCVNKDGGYDCDCNMGYENGTDGPCENINECTRGTDTCSGNATCEDTVGNFTCTCGSFFTGDGVVCTDIDECAASTDPCGVTGTCANKVGGFSCTCADGYTGGTDGPCTDLDECALGTDTCDIDAEANCTNTEGSFTCACKMGYTGDGQNCTDIDECATGADNCDDTGGSCTNTNGSFTCGCQPGYSGDGVTCNNIDECATDTDNCHENAECTDSEGSFTCACQLGYSGDGTICADNDECARGEDNCDGNATCTNNPGGFSCACNDGYSGTGTAGTCSDVDECSNDGACDTNARCDNLAGNFTCECNTGFTGDGSTCTDVNECNDDALNNCHANATCRNIQGSFTCTCDDGYEGTGVECSDIDECVNDDDNNCNRVNGTCDNTNGSFTCSCSPGYSGDGITCLDVDECALGTHTCTAAESTCRNTDGDFECVCIEPTFRGSPGSCNYYCQSNTTCIEGREGSIEIPLYNDGTKTYTAFEEDDWNFMNTAASGSGIRFTFRRFNTEVRDDFLSIYPGDSVNLPLEIVGISGSIGNLHNEQNPVSTSGYIHRDGSSVTAFLDFSGSVPTLTLSSSDIFVIFTSDRQNVSTGFLIEFEYDVDDCPAVDTCNNSGYGGRCQDMPFDYVCRGCTGFIEDKTCDIDINECNQTSSPCHQNATCENSIGSYSCACTEVFTGNGTTCNPLITLDNFRVDRTTTSLSVNFDVTAAWRDPQYITTFEIEIAKVSGGFSRTYRVNLTDFLAADLLIAGLETNTQYEITVSVNQTGSSFGSSVVQNNVMSQRHFTSETNPLEPVNFAVESTSRGRVTLTWEKPAEEGYGNVIHYEICYSFASDSTTTRTVDLRSLSPSTKCYIIDDTFTRFTFTELFSYINITFTIRAFSSVGPSDYTARTVYIASTICEQWVNFASRMPCAVEATKGLVGLLVSEGFPRNVTTEDNEVIRQEWSFDLTSYDGWRPDFKYFSIFVSESAVDYGYGNDINPREHDLEKQAQAGSFTGDQSGVGTAVVKNTSIPEQNLIWFTYISDRTRKEPGFQLEIQLDGNDCLSTPCLNGGACTDGVYDYTCNCAGTAYTGKNCEFPNVIPTVTCTAGKRNATYNFNVQSQWQSDETVIGGYTITISSGGTMNRSLGDSLAGTFTGLTPYTNHTITVTVTASTRDGTVYQVGETAEGSCQTLEDAPTEPRSVNVAPGEKTLVVSWTAPLELNGNVVYIVTHQSTDHGTFGESVQTGSSASLTSTSYTITGLRDYRTYDVTVRAQTGGGFTDAASVSARTSPGAPPAFTSVNVTVIPSRSARVEWTLASSANIGPITVTIAAISEIHAPDPVMVSSTDTPYTFMNLEEGQTYNFTLTASTGTAPDQMTMYTNVDTDSIAPGVPATFTYNRNSSTFEWSAPAPLERNGEITGYVLRAVSTVPGFTTQTFPATTTSYELPGLPPFTSYNFTLQAQNSAGDGIERPLSILTREEVPAAVTTINQSVVTATEITISWPAPPEVGETTYDVTYTDGTTTVGPITTAANSYTLMNLSPFTNYIITVVAKTNAGSANATEVTIQTAESTPSAPQNVNPTFDIANYRITVTWTAPAQANGVLTQYNIRVTANGQSVQDETAPATATSYSFSGVTLSETVYIIRVTASTSIGEGVVGEAQFRTPVLLLNAPRNVMFSDITSTSVVINAEEPENADLGVLRYIVTINQDDTECTAFNDTDCLSNDQRRANSLPYTITELTPYRTYVFSVAGESQAGIGAQSSESTFRTAAATPNVPSITSITRVPGGITVVIAAGSPFTGPANYTVTVTSGDQSTTVMVSGGENTTGIMATVGNLTGGTDYQVSVSAQNDQGSSGSSPSQTTTTSPAAPTFDIERTSNSSLTVTITEVSSATSYTVSYVRFNCSGCVTTPVTIPSTQTSYEISNLTVYTQYEVTVFATSAAGDGVSATMIQRTRAGRVTLVDPNYQLPLSNETEPTLRSSYNVLLPNLCDIKEDVYVETEGEVMSVRYYTLEAGGTGDLSPNTVYGQVHDQDPSPPFLSFEVTCATTTNRRKKRQVTSNGVVIGADPSCADGETTVCNGPLKPGTTYSFQACGVNEEGNRACTRRSDDITTAEEESVPGLTAGEIAAIVICSVLLVILIILLIVYLVKRRRNQTGKHTVSRRGNDNPTFDSKGSQQKYQVDPTAEPQTGYTDASA